MGTARVNSIERNLLVERFKNGESSAFNEIVNRCKDKVYCLAYRFTHNCEDAFDISQEVFIKVFRSLGKLKESAAFDAWLRRVTINACMDHLRQRNNGQILDSSFFPDYEEATVYRLPDSSVENKELLRMISRAIEQLPKRQKRVFMLRYNEGMTLKEISEVMGCSLGTIKAHLFRATRRLRKLLALYIQ